MELVTDSGNIFSSLWAKKTALPAWELKNILTNCRTSDFAAVLTNKRDTWFGCEDPREGDREFG